MSSYPTTILLVDDDEHVVRTAITILKSLGYEVIPTLNPQHALAVIKYCPWVDLLFTDIALPGMTGWDLAAEAKKLRPNLRVLYMTGRASAMVADRKRREPAPLLAKPWRLDQLENVLRQSLA